jgi:DMSO/TMAO reductase YedYZ heme-binding membrane subunit
MTDSNMDSTSTAVFIIAAFSSALILILMKEQIPPAYRRVMALISIVLVAFAFFLIVYSFFSLGTAK